jgi:hypothetical protein
LEAAEVSGPAKTLTPSTKDEQMTEDVTETSDEIDITEGESSKENRTLQEIFDFEKSVALDYAEQLVELIPNIELDEWFEDHDRPMRALQLAQQLRDSLENVECVKLIMAKEV